MRYAHSPRASGLRSNKHHPRELRIIFLFFYRKSRGISYRRTKKDRQQNVDGLYIQATGQLNTPASGIGNPGACPFTVKSGCCKFVRL